jgi:quinol-cytochrome oxidoreductase complex cytochrome b subunit
VIFREVLRPPIWVLAFIYFLFLSIVLSVWAALDDRATLVTLVISTLALIWIAFSMTSEITFDGKVLEIDKANIEVKYLGKVTVLDLSLIHI